MPSLSSPRQLNVLAPTSPAVFYDLLFSAAAETLMEAARNPRRLGADIGVFAILHTWGQSLLLHDHIHCVVPAGGLSTDRARLIATRHCASDSRSGISGGRNENA